MKKIFLSIAITIAAINSVHAQNGVIFEFKISSDKGFGGSLIANYSSAGTRVEIQASAPNMPNGTFAMISIIKSNKPTTVYLLNDKNKTYSTYEVQPQKEANAEACTVKIIGKEKIGNYNCTHAIVTKNGKSNEYWTSTEISEFEKYIKTNSGSKYMASSDEYAALTKAGATGFIIRSRMKDEHNGDVIMELVRMEKKDLPANLFEIPADYKSLGTNSSTGTNNAVIDAEKIKNMTPEERQKYLEALKKQYDTQK